MFHGRGRLGPAWLFVAAWALGSCSLRDPDDPAAVKAECPEGTARVRRHQRPLGLVDLGDVRICKPCDPGVYCPGKDLGPAKCGREDFDDDLDPKTPCAAKSSCAPGTFVSAAGDAKTDRTCTPCAAGGYSAGGTQPACRACEAGTFCPPASPVATPCAPGTWDHDANPATECVPKTPCARGTIEVPNDSTTVDRVCAPCPLGTQAVEGAGPAGACERCKVGTFCPGGTAEPVACGNGDFDHDFDASTPCRPWSTCQPGTWFVVEGTATIDRECPACPTDTYSATPNAKTCTPMKIDCPIGTYQSSSGGPGAASDRVCKPCATGTMSATVNSRTCTRVARAVAVSCSQTCAVLLDGSVSCAGLTTTGGVDVTAKPLAGVSNVARVTLGSQTGCALHTNGAVSCWGKNDYGQVGDGTTAFRTAPVPVPGLTGVLDIVCDGSTCLASSGDATAPSSTTFRQWGYEYTVYEYYGYVSHPVYSNVPRTLASFTGSADIASTRSVVARDVGLRELDTQGQPTSTSLPGVRTARADCAVMADGTVQCRPTGGAFAPFAGLSSVTKVIGNASSGIAIAQGQVVTWGWNSKGQLGNGTTVDRAAAAAVDGLADIVDVAMGCAHNCALRADGAVFCWGDDTNGQLGQPIAGNRLRPTFVPSW